jgi:hypothetical protein
VQLPKSEVVTETLWTDGPCGDEDILVILADGVCEFPVPDVGGGHLPVADEGAEKLYGLDVKGRAHELDASLLTTVGRQLQDLHFRLIFTARISSLLRGP